MGWRDGQRFQEFLDENAEELAHDTQLDQLEKAYKAGYTVGFVEGRCFDPHMDSD